MDTISTPVIARSATPRVGVLVEERYVPQRQPAGLIRALSERGVTVRPLVAEHLAADLSRGGWSDSLDLVVARGRSTALLGLLRALETSGVPVTHTASSVQGVVDKAGMAATLTAAGIPTPRSWLGSPRLLAHREDLVFPLVLKPVTGDNARGLRVVRDRDELAGLPWPEPVALAQQFHRGEGVDLKLYVAGDTVWAVRRPSPISESGALRAELEPGHLTELTPQLVHLARRCRDLFGLTLLGVDCVEGPDGPLVVEVNDFPNYSGVGRVADRALAAVVLAQLGRRGVDGRVPA